jgi:PAS domain S-box-containing protein
MMKNDTLNTGRPLPLSPRELEVLQFAAEGLTDKEIARLRKVSTATIQTYWERIRLKLNAANKAHAVALSMPHNRLELAGEEIAAFILRQIEHEAIFVCDADATMLTWNRGVEALFGYTEQEWVGQSLDLFLIPEDKPKAIQELEEADIAGTSVNYRWHMRKDGSRFWAANIVIPFEPPRGRVSYAKIVRPKEPPE